MSGHTVNGGVYLSRGFDRRAVFEQQFDDFYSIFLGGDMQRCETVLRTRINSRLV